MEVQIHPFATYCALKSSEHHKKYELERLQTVDRSRAKWAKHEDNYKALLKFVIEMDLVSPADLDLFVNLGPFTFDKNACKIYCRDLTFVTMAKDPKVIVAAGNLYRQECGWGDAWFCSEQAWSRTKTVTCEVTCEKGWPVILITDVVNNSWGGSED